jgi:hypothetical protein
MKTYSKSQTILANIPFTAMVLIGAVIMAYAYRLSTWALTAAGIYLIYGIVGAFWIIIFMCPYCVYYDSRGCPCGYGKISAKIVKRGNRECFTDKFKRHIPVIVPLWIIPTVFGGIGLIRSFSWWLVCLLIAFSVNSYIILPLLSRKHSCSECPQKTECPWMA